MTSPSSQERPKISPSDIQVLPDPIKRWLALNPRPAGHEGWWPASDAQGSALDCNADILLMGGSLGSLKTSTMLADLCLERDYGRMRSYFFRRTYAEMEGGDGAIDQAHQLFSQTGGTYNGSTHTWTWPSGAQFFFRHAQHEKDIYQYQGNAMSAIGIDEVTHWPEKMVKYLITRNRSTDPNLFVRVRFGTNPGNIGNNWCKHVFFGVRNANGDLKGICPHCHPDVAPPQGVPRFGAHWLDGEPMEIRMPNGEIVRLSVAYILSSVRDHSMYPASYLARVQMQSPATRKALLEGCWEIFAGQYFDCFNPDRGVSHGMTREQIDAIPAGFGPMVMPIRNVPEKWFYPRWVSSDYGFSISITAAHLFMHAPASPGFPRGRVFVMDEFGCQETAKEFGRLVAERWVLGSDQKPVERRWMPWYLSPDCFDDNGLPFSRASQINDSLRKYGVHFGKGSNQRGSPEVRIYSGLESGELVICEHCSKTIEAVQTRLHDEKKQDEVQKEPGSDLDDFFDSFKMGYMAFETARNVSTPTAERIAERLKKEFSADPTTAMFNAQKIMEEERKKDAPGYYGSNVRRQIAEQEAKGRRRY